MSRKFDAISQVHIGDLVRIKPSIRSPYSGETGTVSEIILNIGTPVYLVHFEDDLVFSYGASELDPIENPQPEERPRPGARPNPGLPGIHHGR